MSRTVLMQWRDGICVMRLSRRASGVKFSLKSLRCLWEFATGCQMPPIPDHGMHKLLERANKETALIMGDFNYHIDWENSEGEKEPYRIFLGFIETSFMQQHVMEPTRGKNMLDLVITSDENMIENVSVGEHFNTSAHQVVR